MTLTGYDAKRYSSRAGNRGLGSQSASQNGQRTSQQRPFAIPTSKRRQTTPDPTTKNNKQQFSRDELAQTASGHGKRRKRNETGDSDEDMENHSPSGKAPNKRLVSHFTRTGQPINCNSERFLPSKTLK